MTAIDELLARNRAVAAYYPVGMGPMPTLKIAMLMCMDARINGHGAFGLTRVRSTCSATPAASSPTTPSAPWRSPNTRWEPAKS